MTQSMPRLPSDITTPAYVLDAAKLAANMATADRIRREAGCKMLLATKAWAMPAAFTLMRDHLDGTTASGEYEARLGREEFGEVVLVGVPRTGPVGHDADAEPGRTNFLTHGR